MTSPLARLVGTDQVDGFRQLSYEKGATHVVGHGDSWSDVFSLATMDELLADRGLRAGSVRVVRGGIEYPEHLLSAADPGDAGASHPYLSSLGVSKALRQGYTVALRNLQLFHEPVRRFTHALGRELGHPVHAFAYLTPPGSQGLKSHYDVHDVFAIQLVGTKRWELQQPAIPQPVPAQPGCTVAVGVAGAS